MNDVVYFAMLKRREFTNWDELAKSYSRDFTLLRERLQKFPLVEILGQETTYGTMDIKSPKNIVEQMYGIKLTYAPRKEPLGQRFPESKIMIDHTWLIEGAIKIPKELEDIVKSVIIP